MPFTPINDNFTFQDSIPEMNPEDAITLVKKTIEPSQLNEIEELVLSKTLYGMRYQEIASSAGYDMSYVKDVGARVWRQLSNSIGKKVTKKNLRVRLKELYDLNSNSFSKISLSIPESARPPGSIIFPGSPQFIQRSELESFLRCEIQKVGSLVSLRSAEKTGKTSLVLKLIRDLDKENFKAIYIRLDQVDHDCLKDLDTFLRWLTLNIERKLGLRSKLDESWFTEFGSKVNFSTYFQEIVLGSLNYPIILVLDEIRFLYNYPTIFKEFISVFHYLYDQSSISEMGEKLRLVLILDTDCYRVEMLGDSIFELGKCIRVPGFCLQEAYELAAFYKLDFVRLSQNQIEYLVQLTDGNPYLLHVTFEYFSLNNVSVDDFFESSGYHAGIYNGFLRKKLSMLLSDSKLLSAFQDILTGSSQVSALTEVAYNLDNIGLVKIENGAVKPRCPLYKNYFTQAEPSWRIGGAFL